MPRDPRTARPDRPGGRKHLAIRRTVLGTALAGALLVGGGQLTGLMTVPGTAGHDSIIRTVAGDTSVSSSRLPSASSGAAGTDAETVMKFHVPAAPSGYVVSQAHVAIRVDDRTRARLDAAGGGRAVSYQVRSGAGSMSGEATLSRGGKLTLDVTDAVRGGGGADIAVSMPVAMGSDVSKVASSRRPELVVKFKSMSSTKPRKPASAKPNTPGTAKPFVPLTETSVRIGMSAPSNQWATRLAETGPIDARRIFGRLQSPTSALKLARSEVAAGRLPIVSFKVPNNDWAGVAAGKYDTQLRSITSQLAALNGPVFVTLHHEPNGDGTPANFAAMMRHALPILGAPANVDAGPIANGFWWSAESQGLTDAQIAQWLPADVLKVSEIVAADTYQAGTASKPGETAAVKIRRLSAWADRVGVKRLGIGEYNGFDAASIRAAGDAILSDPRYAFASIFNSPVNNPQGVDWTLEGARLSAFKETVRQARAAG